MKIRDMAIAEKRLAMTWMMVGKQAEAVTVNSVDYSESHHFDGAG